MENAEKNPEFLPNLGAIAVGIPKAPDKPEPIPASDDEASMNTLRYAKSVAADERRKAYKALDKALDAYGAEVDGKTAGALWTSLQARGEEYAEKVRIEGLARRAVTVRVAAKAKK